ncbi:MAG: excinuclease ABC subunit UvrB [Candidatus Delongbacteria bacterium]|nr:excinuclease ABC subunit UvrB [Candidatus Delongbacteria bacterium]
MKQEFELKSPFAPCGDQIEAIEQLVQGLAEQKRHQVLLGVTGSGKTFTMANVIARVNRPTLILSHNKTLAAQLYGELRSFFPDNAVEFFISYYDYYQPEAYLPQTDTYIEKETDINQEIDRLRLKATSSLISRRDVIVVASVSSIYGLGSPQEYREMLAVIRTGEKLDRRDLLNRLVAIQYSRNDIALQRGSFRVRGDVLEIHPAWAEGIYRIETFDDEVERITLVHQVTGEVLEEVPTAVIYPAKHFVTTEERVDQAVERITEELAERTAELQAAGRLLEAQRLEQRTRFDMEMLHEVGYCSGIENYSRHFDGRAAGERPATLLDYFPDDFLTIIDESHVTLPQVRAMYRGDRARKEMLVEYGFRLPSALDNRPLFFEEFLEIVGDLIYTTATPGDWELEQTGGEIVEQVIRPTGLLDPEIEVRPTTHQVDDLMEEIRQVVGKGQRVLVTTLTKRMSEDLTEYLAGAGIRVRYLHSEIKSLERVEILRGLRLQEFDVLVGINLLREGLDLPEVSLVAILDADREGFLRSERSLMQVSGRAARHAEGRVIMYADRITPSMEKVLGESSRRRQVQEAYNRKHNITPRTVSKSEEEIRAATGLLEQRQTRSEVAEGLPAYTGREDPQLLIELLQRKMAQAAEELNFEQAAICRDEIRELQRRLKKKA